MHRVGLAWVLVLGIWAWTAALVAAPSIVASGKHSQPAIAAGLLVYVVGGVVCHQHPARSIHVWGAPMPVCARCTGLYVGAGLGISAGVITAYRRRWRPLRHAGSEALGAWRIGLVVAAVPTAATFAVEKVGGVPLANGVRLWAGVILGAAVGWVVASSLRGREAAGAGSPEVNYPDGGIDGGAKAAG